MKKIIVNKLDKIHVLVTHVAKQHPKGDIKEITSTHLARISHQKNFFTFYLTKAALPSNPKGEIETKKEFLSRPDALYR